MCAKLVFWLCIGRRRQVRVISRFHVSFNEFDKGFMLDNPLLVTVGSLIGVSGSILSYIMVNRLDFIISSKADIATRTSALP